MAGINTEKNDQEINIPAGKKTIEEERQTKKETTNKYLKRLGGFKFK